MININDGKCCDNCVNYEWYYDKCKKYNCEVDARSVCSDFIPYNKDDKNSEDKR